MKHKSFAALLFIIFFSVVLSSCGAETTELVVSVDEDNQGVTETDLSSDMDMDEQRALHESDENVFDDDLPDGAEFPDEDCAEGPVEAAAWDPGTPESIIITTDTFSDSFQRLAALHTMTGVPTEVVTVAEICDGSCDDTDPLHDTPSAIKAYIASRPNLFYVTLGGDIDDVPSRQVYDEYSHVMAGSYEGDFYTDYYYSDLSDWDSDGNGVYAEEGSDTPDYRPDVTVGRIPVSTVDEVNRFIDKVLKYMTAFPPENMLNTTLIANVATNFSGVEINAGYYFEAENRTVAAIPPHVPLLKLYADTFPKPAPDMQVLTVDVQKQAMQSGQNLIVHNGHGYPTLLSAGFSSSKNNFTDDMAYNLQNDNYFIFLSCACQAGEFEAPFTYTYTDSQGNEQSREFTDDSAGEQLVNAPDGGAVAYLGNTTTGLGIAGGSQLIDEMVRHIFSTPSPRLGDAFFNGHMNLKERDTFTPPVISQPVPVVDPDSYRWTQKAVVLLGDPVMPVWNKAVEIADAPAVTVMSNDDGLLVSVAASGDVDQFRMYVDSHFYTVPAVSGSTVTVPVSASTVYIGTVVDNRQYLFKSLSVE